MRRLARLMISTLLSLSLFGIDVGGGDLDETAEFFSFESDFEGWTAHGTDLELGDGFIDWSITRSEEKAKHGTASLKFSIDNRNDNGKIWVERPFTVEPNQIYQVNVKYAFASHDYGQANLFDIITGVLKKRPQTRYDLYPALKNPTGNGSDSDVGHKWKNREYEFTLRSDDQTMLYVVIGIAGTHEVGRTYYFDNVSVTFSKKPPESEFYSFENDMEGWTARGTDLEVDNGSVDWSITRSEEFWEDGAMSVLLDLNNTNGKGKIWIERPFVVEPKQTYKVRIDYSISTRFQAGPFFRIITGVQRQQPATADDLANKYQDEADVELYALWLHKNYEFKVKSKRSNVLYVVIGLWGTYNAHRTYWFDNVCVTVTKK